MSCMVHAICMKNLNGGLEIYSDIYCQSPVTFGKKGLTYIKRKPQKDAEDSHITDDYISLDEELQELEKQREFDASLYSFGS